MRCIDDPIAIRTLKRVAAEKGGPIKFDPPDLKTGNKVAVIGSGPSGFTAAFHLARLGHEVDVFEAREKAGGMMRLQLSENGLTEEVLDAEINTIKGTGFNLRTSTPTYSGVASLLCLPDLSHDFTHLAHEYASLPIIGLKYIR